MAAHNNDEEREAPAIIIHRFAIHFFYLFSQSFAKFFN